MTALASFGLLAGRLAAETENCMRGKGMNKQRQIGPILGLAAAISLAACGGGSSGNDAANNPAVNNPPAGGSVNVTSIGTITGFSSVYVNGTKYEVDSSTRVSIEDEAETMGDDSALRVGMKVSVSATDDNGIRTAQSIEYDDDLKGPIESITPDGNDPAIGTLSVMSQTVFVDANTAFDDDIGDNDGMAGIDFRDLQVGMIVEVSGYPTDDGILATRLDREIAADGTEPSIGDPSVDDDELELKGFVDAIADDLSSITVNGVIFLVDMNTMLDAGLSLSVDLVGAFVEVEADIVGDDYVARKIEREDDFDDEGEFEIEGILQAVDTSASPNTFTINGITVSVNDASSLQAFVNMQVEVKGNFDANGVLVLREVHEEEEDNIRTEDLVASVNTTNGTFTTRLGIVIEPTGGSRVKDDTSDDGDHLTPDQFIGRLQAGDRIEARGVDDGSGGVAWTGVEREELFAGNDDFECELRGPVESISGDENSFSFIIQGVTVETGRVQNDDFKDDDEIAIGRAGFFSRLQEGNVVEAESFEGDAFCMSGMLDARQVEFEGIDD
jgi:hypothetical protein